MIFIGSIQSLVTAQQIALSEGF